MKITELWQPQAEINEIAGLFEALALREVLLAEGRVDEAGAWSAVKSIVGKGVAGVKSANDAINRLGQLAQNTGPVQAFDSKVDAMLKKIGAANPKVAEAAKRYGEWAKKNPIKQGLIIGMLTAVASLVSGPAGGAAAAAVLRAGNELLKGEKASTAIGKAVKGAAYGWLAGMGVRELGNFVANMHISLNPVKGIRDLTKITLDYAASETGKVGAHGHLSAMVPEDMVEKIQKLWGAGKSAAAQGRYELAQKNFNTITDYFASSKYQTVLDGIIDKNTELYAQKNAIFDAAEKMKQFANALAAVTQGAVSGASAASGTATKAQPTAARTAPAIAAGDREALQQKRAALQKRLRQQGRLK
jgi:hypothetical protein